MFMRRLVALTFTLLASVAAVAEIPPFALEFEVSRNGKPLGEAALTLERLNSEAWLFRSHTEGTKGLASLAGVDIDERSEFRWADGKPQTLRYSFSQKMRFNSKQRALSVMPNAERVSGRDGNEDYTLPYEPGLLDRNLVVLALAVDVAKDIEKLEYRVADKRRVESNQYRVAGTEKLETPRGTLDAIRVERIRRGSGRQTTTWIAPSLGFLPVRIRQIEPDGDTIDMTLR